MAILSRQACLGEVINVKFRTRKDAATGLHGVTAFCVLVEEVDWPGGIAFLSANAGVCNTWYCDVVHAKAFPLLQC